MNNVIVRRIIAVAVSIGTVVLLIWGLSLQLKDIHDKAYAQGMCKTKCGEVKSIVEREQCYCVVEKK